MYIPYNKIGQTIALGFPKNSTKIIDFFNSIKVNANCKWISKNKKNVLKKLKQKFNKTPLKVVFYVYENCRWKSQSLYDLMLNDKRFEPLIVVTKNCSKEGNANYQTIEDIKITYNFFKEKGMNVEYGYDIEKDEFIPFEKFNPDIVFYSHPWYVETSQGPVVCSKFALTYYIPYFLPNTSHYIEYDLRFHQYIHKYYVLNNLIKDFYHKKQTRKSNNMVSAGHTQLDYFYLNKPSVPTKRTVIYSPHWTIRGIDNIAYSTFDWNGEAILEFAKSHPEIEWIFRPHPLLYKNLICTHFWSKEQTDNYYNEWKKFAKFSDCGNYLDIFNNSYAMITDCGSFLTEYLLSEKPVIHLVSQNAMEYNDAVKKITKSYYQAHNLSELNNYLEDVIINQNDYKKQDRINVLEELELRNNYCAANILKNIEEELSA